MVQPLFRSYDNYIEENFTKHFQTTNESEMKSGSSLPLQMPHLDTEWHPDTYIQVFYKYLNLLTTKQRI